MCLKEFRSKFRKREPPRRRPSNSLLWKRSIEALCNVDQFCRNTSSIIVFSGLPRLERWAAPAVVEFSSQHVVKTKMPRLAGERDSLMATNGSTCHPGDGMEALNRLPGLAEPL